MICWSMVMWVLLLCDIRDLWGAKIFILYICMIAPCPFTIHPYVARFFVLALVLLEDKQIVKFGVMIILLKKIYFSFKLDIHLNLDNRRWKLCLKMKNFYLGFRKKWNFSRIWSQFLGFFYYMWMYKNMIHGCSLKAWLI